jgi:hypothetical protein
VWAGGGDVSHVVSALRELDAEAVGALAVEPAREAIDP